MSNPYGVNKELLKGKDWGNVLYEKSKSRTKKNSKSLPLSKDILAQVKFVINKHHLYNIDDVIYVIQRMRKEDLKESDLKIIKSHSAEITRFMHSVRNENPSRSRSKSRSKSRKNVSCPESVLETRIPYTSMPKGVKTETFISVRDALTGCRQQGDKKHKLWHYDDPIEKRKGEECRFSMLKQKAIAILKKECPEYAKSALHS
jgi:hypothetical protein